MDITSQSSFVSVPKIKGRNPSDVTPEQGLECLNRILEENGLPEGFLEKFREKVFDKPSALFDYGALGRFSPATLRLINILLDLRGHFGDLNGKNVVEIGGRSGGQREVLASLFKLASYTVYDLPPDHPVSCDLVISHFNFGESSCETREVYLDKIFSHAKAGYLVCPATEELSSQHWASRIPGAKIIAEEPFPVTDCFVLIWGHRPIAAVSKYRRNVVSQSGEDGVLEEIFLRIGSGGKLCVEFGAWDGKYASNTWNLWARHGWSAVLIESDADRFRDLTVSLHDFPAVKAINAFVTNEPGMLDGLLGSAVGDRSVDLLSIDIDGDDYHVFRALQKYLPRVLVIEFNATIPERFHLIPEPGAGIGASARALYFLAHEKGYTLAAITGCNLIFVQNSEFSKLGMQKCSLKEIFPQDALTYLMTPYETVPFASRLPAFIGLDAKMYRKKLPVFVDSNRWYPVHIRHLHLAQNDERRSLTPSASKQRTVKELGYLYLADRLIRTGLAGESMEEDCKGNFKEAFIAMPGELDQILAGMSEPCVFWINNPFTPGQPDPARIEEIRSELKSLLICRLPSPIILVDHARLFNGEDGYPHIDRLEEETRKLRPDLAFEVRNDILRIHPTQPPVLNQRILHDLNNQLKYSLPKNGLKRWLKRKLIERRIRQLSAK